MERRPTLLLHQNRRGVRCRESLSHHFTLVLTTLKLIQSATNTIWNRPLLLPVRLPSLHCRDSPSLFSRQARITEIQAAEIHAHDPSTHCYRTTSLKPRQSPELSFRTIRFLPPQIGKGNHGEPVHGSSPGMQRRLNDSAVKIRERCFPG
ncbi:putative anoctamin-7 [Sesbania bispinosa]|nr:putative anoctamin-7 [Sesbania bispinosa]